EPERHLAARVAPDQVLAAVAVEVAAAREGAQPERAREIGRAQEARVVERPGLRRALRHLLHHELGAAIARDVRGTAAAPAGGERSERNRSRAGGVAQLERAAQLVDPDDLGHPVAVGVTHRDDRPRADVPGEARARRHRDALEGPYLDFA